MMVDRQKVDMLLGLVSEYVAQLRRLATVERTAFIGDPDKVASAKYHFVVAIECCIDIAMHTIASERFRTPADNADGFTVLVERGVCPTDLENALRAMVRFRNRLVHVYWEVDDALIADYLQRHLGDFDRYVAAVRKLL